MRIVTDDERRARIGARHALAAPVADTLAATRAMTCLHATEPANVYLSAFARSGAGRAEIADALFTRRTVVRQLAMRRTVFAFPRNLLPAVWGSTSARVAAQLAARLAKEIEAAGVAADGPAWVDRVGERTLAAIRASPSTSAQLRAQVPELNARIALTGLPGDTPVAPRLLAVLAATGRVVRGENAGGWQLSRPVWTAVEQWLPDVPPPVDEAAGYAELVRRWLWSFGPGTEDDLVWWLGATKGAVRQSLAAVGAAAVELADGSPAWLHPEDTDPVPAGKPWAALLPALDPTAMGWRHRTFYLAGHRELIFDRNGNAGPTAWWDSRIVGSWTQRPDGTVVVVPIGALPRAATAALSRKAAQLSEWLAGEQVGTIYKAPLVRAAPPEAVG